MARLHDLAQEAFNPLWGTPVASYLPGNNVKLITRIAKSTTGFVLGTMKLGDPLTSKEWVDISDDVHGHHIEMGAPAGTRPGFGSLTLNLCNDSGEYHPKNSRYYGPGTLIQVGLVSGGGLLNIALFTGFIDSWPEQSAAINGVRWIQIKATETPSVLVESNNPAVAPIGAGDSPLQRVERILTAAGWQFGYSVPPMFGTTLQATTLAQAASAELFLTADSVVRTVVSSKRGDLVFAERDDTGTVSVELGGADIPIVADSIVTANDNDTLIGSISVARVGGTAVTYTGRFVKYRSTQRHDLITENPGANEDLEAYADDQLTRRQHSYRVEQLQLDSSNGHDTWTFITSLSWGKAVNVIKPDTDTEGVIFQNYTVCGYTLDIEPVADTDVRIVATIETEPAGTSTTWSAYP